MKNKFFMLFVVMCFSVVTMTVFAEAETDIVGWEKAEWGMTHTQISKLYDLKDWDKNDPLKCDMKEGIKVESEESYGNLGRILTLFFISFGFDEQAPSGKLNKIERSTLLMTDRSEGKYWNEITTSLIEQYGKPDSEKIDEKEGKKIITWTRPSGRLTFSASHNCTNMCFGLMTYTSKDYKDEEKKE